MKYTIDSIKKEQAYHHSVLMVMMKAIIEVFGMDVNVRVGNSLNQGFFVYLGDTSAPLSTSDISRIEEHMEAIIRADIPIETVTMTNEEAVKLWKEYDVPEKVRLLGQRNPEERLEISDIGGYKNCFFSEMVPSTSYVDTYEIRKYRNGFLLRVPYMLSNGKVSEYRDDDKLYEAFADSKKMRKSMGLDYLSDLNEAIRAGRGAELIAEAEKLQQQEIEEIAEEIAEKGRRLILIAGPSSSGKTTFAKRLCAAIGEKTTQEPIYLGTDDYFLNRAETPLGPDGQPDYEGLSALDIELFNSQMKALLNGESIDAPEYDFVTGEKKFGVRTITPLEGQTLVIEGIHSLNDDLTPDIPAGDKYKIYISPLTRIGIDRHNRLSTTDARMLRRMVRDNQFRGTDAAGTLANWYKVRSGENVNIFPYSSYADHVFNSSLVYETALMKTYAQPLLEEIAEDAPEYEEAQRMIAFLRYFEPISRETAENVPDNSLLREFIGK